MARPATARFTDGLSGWFRSALPGVVIDAPGEDRGRRDRIVDATIYLVAFAISAATLAGTWEMHPPWLRVVDVVVGIATLVSLTWRRTHHAPGGSRARWLRVVDVVVGIATLVSLHWRRTHPAAVGIGVGSVSLVILPAAGANLAATFNAAIRA